MRTLANYLCKLFEDALFDAPVQIAGIDADFYVNPTMNELNSLGGNARGLITSSGNLIVAQPQVLHQKMIDFFISKGMLRANKGSSWKDEVQNFIGVKQYGKTIKFQLADSYNKDIIEKNKDKIQEILNARKNEGITKKIPVELALSKSAS